MAKQAKKKNKSLAEQWQNSASDLKVVASYYRLPVVAILLAVVIILAAPTKYQPPAYEAQPVLGARLAPKDPPVTPRAPDSSPRTTGPLLMPWRGPIKPLPLEPTAAAVIYEIPTTDPVVFLTIDDGVTQEPETADWLISHHLPFSLFLDDHAIRNNYAYFRRLQDAGMTIQNHTVNHARLKNMTYEQQKAEICGASDIFTNVFGKRPTLFRPPYAQFNDDTRRAVLECGMRAIVMWRAVVENGQVFFQYDKTHLNSGDIVLMHFKPGFKEDMDAFTRQVQKDHLRVGRLEDWLR